ncbi:MAG: T9SS type A sorting domain-containing protein [Phaeodactylibacter sp.]|nr:T9SS type A sorting domain-containing protein [Phaeodactylibacter sp.]
MARFYASFVLLLAITGAAAGQNVLEIRNNNLRIFLRSDGALLPPAGIHGFDYELPDGTFAPLIHYTGLWLGAHDGGGNLYYATTHQGGNPGPFNAPPGFDKAWQVTAAQIAAHRQDFEDGQINTPIPAVYAWPGRGNPRFFEYNGFELPSGLSGGLAPFWDEDGDGIYNPSNGDYPVLEIRNCNLPIIPTQMNWTVFTLSAGAGHPLEISLNVFYFDCAEANPLRESIFTHYKITDRADFAGPLTETRWGLFTDADLGCPLDDYIGSFPERASAYVYNADDNDENCFGLSGFGANPPALGIDVYRGPLGTMAQEVPLASIIPFFNPTIGSFPPGVTDPNTLPEYFNYLQGNWRDGSPLTEGGIGYGGSEPAAFAFPGLPEQNGGWTEWEAGNPEGDRRVVMSFDAFELFPGAVNEFIAGYSVYREGENHLAQAAGLRDQLDLLQAYFDNCLQVNADIPELPPCTEVMTGLGEPTRDIELAILPNPAQGIAYVKTEAAIKRIVLFDATGRQALIAEGGVLDLSRLPPGLYFAHVRTNEGIAVRKLVVD